MNKAILKKNEPHRQIFKIFSLNFSYRQRSPCFSSSEMSSLNLIFPSPLSPFLPQKFPFWGNVMVCVPLLFLILSLLPWCLHSLIFYTSHFWIFKWNWLYDTTTLGLSPNLLSIKTPNPLTVHVDAMHLYKKCNR